MRRSYFLIATALCLAASFARAERLPRAVIPEHYSLVIVPRIDYRTFLGNEVIAVDVREPVREITLHAVDLEIESAQVRDSERRQRAQVELNPERSTMTLRFRRDLVPGRAEIRISYRGPLRDDLRGLYVSRSGRETFLFTQLQPVDARRFFPCFDEPDLKARFDLSVVVGARHSAISNTRAISTLPGPTTGSRRIRFATTPPISTYMLALAIGPFECLSGRRGGVPVRFCAREGIETKGQATFEGAMELVDFYQGWLGVPYPFDKLDVVAVPDLAAGGMENPGAVFLRESWATVGANAPLETRRWAASLLAHELSHMWVGDLVTMRGWSDVWLNEGLATWLASRALGAWQPEMDIEEMKAMRRMRALDEDSARRPAIAAPVEDESSLFELFDVVTTEKAAAMMAMVERMAGEDVLRAALREYLITYSWGSVDTGEFIEHVGRSVGGDVAAVIRDYVSRPGFPEIEVSTACADNDARVVFSQADAGGAAWHVPVCYRALGPGSSGGCVLVRNRTVVDLKDGCGSPLIANAGEPGYYRVRYGKADLDRIVDAAPRLTLPEKIALLDDEWWLVLEGHRAIGDYLALIGKGFSSEQNPAVVGMIVARLGFVERHLVSDADRAAFASWTRAWALPQFQGLGRHPITGEVPGRSRLRRELLWAAGAIGSDPRVIEEARRHVRDLLNDRGDGDRSYSDVMLHIAARSGDEALYNAYLSRIRRARSPQDGYRYLMGLTSFTSPALVERTIDLTTTGVVRAQDVASVVSRLLATPLAADVAWRYLRERWGEIAKQLPVTFTSERIVQGAGSFCSEERREEVAAFFEGVGAPPRALESSLARIDRCVAARDAQSADLGRWLATWNRD
jgi:aminopeptidase N